MRPTVVHLSENNLLHNLSTFRRTAPGKKIIAMLKANAYGHGIRSVGMRLEGRVEGFGVASIDEALALRKVGIKTDIMLVAGVFSPQELSEAAEHDCHVVFHDPEQIAWLQETYLPARSMRAWIKVDTGLGRLGFLPEKVAHARAQLAALPCVQPEIGLMSHLACSDELNHPLNEHQYTLFSGIARDWPGPKSFAKGAPSLTDPRTHFDWIRPGVALYGVSPIEGGFGSRFDLRPVMRFESAVLAIKTLPAGHGIGYGQAHICKKPTRVGVVAVGYGDGYARSLRPGTPLLIEGVRCPLVGRVSMDMCTVDLTDCPQAHVTSRVILWGSDLPVEEIATWGNTSPYALVAGIQPRLPFIWG